MKVNPGQPFLEMFMDSWCFMISCGGGMLAVMQEQELRASACSRLIPAVRRWLGSSPISPVLSAGPGDTREQQEFTLKLCREF